MRRGRSRRPCATSVALGLAIGTLAIPALAGTVTVETHAGRSVRVFVPATPATPTALVVMLHGCTQTAADFADATQMEVVAEKHGFVVAYPEQSADTISTRCFRWYDPAHQARDAGEPKELAAAADGVARAHGVDAERVYIAGISAGAAMSVILGATYPDRFTAIGVVAGIEYRGAGSISEALTTTSNGGPDPAAQGALAHTQMGPRARVVPTFVMHGTSDGVVAKVNGDQVTAQWLATNTLVLGPGAIAPATAEAGSTGYPFRHFVHRSTANGAPVIEQYVVDGLGHAWPGGKDGASYSDAKGPHASELLWAFFQGRTRTSPLDVPPGTPPPGTTADGGITTDPSAPGAARAGEPSANGGGGGCALGRGSLAPVSSVAVGAMLLAALGLKRRRR